MKLPSRPKLVYVERKKDNRRFAVVPFRAAIDNRLSKTDLITLITLASYASSNGYTFVSLDTMANLRGIKKQSVSTYIRRLEQKGYIETVRKGYTNMRGALRRILYDPKLSELEQVSIANDNTVEVFDMSKHIQKRSKPGKKLIVEQSRLSYDDAILVAGHLLKSDADLLKLERLVSAGISRDALLAAFS